MSRVSVLGSGSWGTAIALASLRAGSDVTLWSKFPEEISKIKADKENKALLPGITLPDDLKLTSDIEEACKSNIIVLVTPSQTIRDVVTLISPYIKEDTYLIMASKGIEIGTHMFMSDIVKELIPHAGIAVLSGPSFADEVGMGLPTAITLAAENMQTATYLSTAFNSDTFRVYSSDDIIGCQIGGALKNVLAIATGIARGMKLGANAEAAIITRGIVEISRLANAMGAKKETLIGLAGVGDIVLTCSHEKSRNMSLGVRIGKGETPEDILKSTGKTVEGFATSKSICSMAKESNIDMPICEALDKILNEGASVKDCIRSLMIRPMKSETD